METPPIEQPGRIRRLIIHPASLLVIGLAMTIVPTVLAMIAAGMVLRPAGPVLSFLSSLIACMATVLGYLAFTRWVERRPAEEFALTGAGRETLTGIAFGAGLFAIATGVVALAGGFAITRFEGFAGLLGWVGIAIYSGVAEETIFRGVALRQLERLIGTIGAVAATSAFFGFAHLINPNSTLFAGFAIALEAGVLLGAAFLLTRRLWLAIGIHGAWNFTQGWIFGVPVSGSSGPPGLFASVRVGPEWLTGGAFGLEASAVAMLVCAAGGFFLLLRSRPSWKGLGAPGR